MTDKTLFRPRKRALAVGVASLITVLAVFFLSGCETTSESNASAAKRSSSSSVVLEKGMTMDEVLASMGEPDSIQEVVEDNVVAEIWTYQHERVTSSTIESDGEQERSYIDRTTGLLVTVREPIYRNEEIKARITTQLLFHDGVVVALKEQVEDGVLKVGHR